MPDTAPWDVVGAVRSGTASGVFEVEDPEAVAAQLAGQPGVIVATPADLAEAVARAKVGLAAVLVERARQAESAVAIAADAGADAEHEVDADWQAVRFALLILLFALPAGLLVYAVDGMVLAAALPAAALVALGVVVFVHRPLVRPAPPARAEAVAPDVAVPVDEAPAVRAAEAHLRRQQAGWKVTWWERGEPVPQGAGGGPAPGTLVVVDPDGVSDETAHATTTLAGAVRVVVLRART